MQCCAVKDIRRNRAWVKIKFNFLSSLFWSTKIYLCSVYFLLFQALILLIKISQKVSKLLLVSPCEGFFLPLFMWWKLCMNSPVANMPNTIYQTRDHIHHIVHVTVVKKSLCIFSSFQNFVKLKQKYSKFALRFRIRKPDEWNTSAFWIKF